MEPIFNWALNWSNEGLHSVQVTQQVKVGPAKIFNREKVVTKEAEHIFARAKALSPIERAELIEHLFSTFDFPERSEVDEKWAQEAESRVDAFDSGKLQSVSEEDVFARFKKQASR